MKKVIVITSVISITAVISVLTAISLVKRSQNCKGFCFSCNGCRNQQDQKISYYIDKREKLNNEFHKKQKIFLPSLKKFYTSEQIDKILIDTSDSFNSLIKDIPYIGGDSSPMTEDMEQAAMVLAFYRVQKNYGRTTQEIGTIIIESIEREIDKYPKWIRHIIGGQYFTKKHIEKVKQNSLATQQKEYEYDWVTFFVEGDGQTFDYGFNHTECGIVKYMSENQASDLIPYLCSLDFVYSDAFDEGLTRTSTIAQDDTFCDFRYKRQR